MIISGCSQVRKQNLYCTSRDRYTVCSYIHCKLESLCLKEDITFTNNRMADDEYLDMDEEEKRLIQENDKLKKAKRLADLRKENAQLAGDLSQDSEGANYVHTYTLTMRKENEHQFSESHSKSQSAGISVKLSSDTEAGLNHSKSRTSTVEWTKKDIREGSLKATMGAGATGSVDPLAAFTSMMGISGEDIKAIQYK